MSSPSNPAALQGSGGTAAGGGADSRSAVFK